MWYLIVSIPDLCTLTYFKSEMDFFLSKIHFLCLLHLFLDLYDFYKKVILDNTPDEMKHLIKYMFVCLI